MQILSLRRCLILILISLALTSGCKANHRPNDASSLAGDSAASQQKLGDKRAAWFKDVTFQDLADYPTVPAAGNEIVTFIVQLPLNQGDFGHAALAVGDDFFDFGPLASYEKIAIGPDWAGLQRPSKPTEGGGWWKNPERWKFDVEATAITYSLVLQHLGELTKNYTTLLIPIEVSAEHAQNIRGWWERFYQSSPKYSAPGLHCVSAVAKSFEASDPAFKSAALSRLTGANLWSPETTRPISYAEKLLSRTPLSWNNTLNYTHRAGPRQGQKLKAIVVVAGAELANTSYKAPASLVRIKMAIKAGLKRLAKPLDAGASGADSSTRDSRDAGDNAPEPPPDEPRNSSTDKASDSPKR